MLDLSTVPVLRAEERLLAEVVDGRLTTKAVAGLPGVNEGGRYVFYRLTQAVGFVAGQTRIDDIPTRASVATSSPVRQPSPRPPAKGSPSPRAPCSRPGRPG